MRRPSMDDFVLDGEQTPWLFQKRVVAGVVLAFVALIGGYVGLTSALGLSTQIDAKPLRSWVEGLGPLGPLAFIGIMALSVLFAPIPNVPVFVAAGLVWGSVLGTVYSVAGLLLGSIMAFWISRWLGRRWLPRLVGTKAAARLDAVADSMGGRVLFWARMLPAVNFDWISFVAGVTSIRFPVFVLASFLGMLLPTAVAVVAGDGLGRDFRLTIAAGAAWLLGIVGSAAYFWWERGRRRSRVGGG